MGKNSCKREYLQWSMVLVLFIAPSAWSADIYVSVNGEGDGRIISPMDLQSALDLARLNGSEDIIYLMEGEYDASSTGADTFEYGSINNDGMKTTLSGSWDSTYTVQDTFEAPSTKLDGKGTSRVMHVHADGVNFDFVIEYMQLENGMIMGSGEYGAGLLAYNENGGVLNLTLHHISFEDNRTAIDSSNRCYGGGMYSNCFFEMTENRFKDNQAYVGGAMCISDSPGGDKSMAPVIEETSFEGNSSGVGSLSGSGGSTIYYNCSPVIKRSVFRAPDYGILGYYPASALDSGYGAGTLTLENSTFYGFRAYYWGGAISLWDTNADISNCLFIDNSAGNSGNGAGGAITVYDSTPDTHKNTTFTNCTFVGNRTNGSQIYGGAIYNRVQGITVINSIFWDNGTKGLATDFGPSLISYSDIEGGVVNSNMTDGGNNIVVDPLFVNRSVDPGDWDLHLQETSQCVDSGDNNAPYLTTLDLDDYPRISDGNEDGAAIVDMGCYEIISPKGDINSDKFIDLTDGILGLQILANIVPPPPVTTESDINEDNKIGLEEVVYILKKVSGAE